jgi:acyl carrier protein
MSELSRADIHAALQGVFREVFQNETLVLKDSTTATDVAGWDSMQQIKILLACEKKFGIRLKARDINGLQNIGAMIDHLMTAIARARR